MKPRLPLALVFLVTFAGSAVAQQTTLSRWLGNATEPAPLWSTPGNWAPAGVPAAVPGAPNDVSISGSLAPVPPLVPAGYGFFGPALDVSATITNLFITNGGALGTGFGGPPDFFNRTLDVTGSTSFTTGGGLITAVNGCTYSLGTLLNQDNGILRAPASLVALADHLSPATPTVIQWRGANIIRNEGYIVHSGDLAFFRDQTTGADGLTNFRDNAGSINTGGGTFTTGGAFTNSGLLQVFAFGPGLSRFVVGGNFVNFDPNTGVLSTGFVIQLDGVFGRAEFAFPGADIRTLSAGSGLKLNGDAAILDSVTGANGLRHLGELGGDFTLGSALGLTPADGTLRQVGGNLNVQTNGFITVTGNLQQFQGATVTLAGSGGAPARLTITGSSTVMGQFILGDSSDVVPTPDNALLLALDRLNAGSTSDVTGSGTIGSNGIEFQGRVTPGFILGGLAPRPAAKSTANARRASQPLPARVAGAEPIYRITLPDGSIGVPSAPARTGALTAGAGAGTEVFPGRMRLNGPVVFTADATTAIGVTAGRSSVLEQSGAGGIILGGTLEVTLTAGSTGPLGSAQFSVVQASSLSGEYANAPNHSRLATTGGEGSFVVSYVHGPGYGLVVLSDFQPAPLGPVTVFTGEGTDDSTAWSDSGNWTLDAPGVTAFNAEIPGGFATVASTSFAGLGTLRLRPDASTLVSDDVRLDFGQVTLESGLAGYSDIRSAGVGGGILAASRIVSTGANGDTFGPFSSLGIDLTVRQTGAIPAVLTLAKASAGTFEVDANVQPFAGSQLVLDAAGSGLLNVVGPISEVAPATATNDGGASVLVSGRGVVRLAGANTYSGGTLVRDSLTFTGLGGYFVGGLIVENAAGSATGSGPVRLVTTPGPTSATDNRGVLTGTGFIAGDLSVEGGILLPGNVSGKAVGTLTLGGSLTLTDGAGAASRVRSALLIDLDPQNADPLRRSDQLVLPSTGAQVSLQSCDLSIFLIGPPSPGQVFRIIDAPNAANALGGTFNGLPQGATVSPPYGGVNFAFVITYGANYVQLAHLNPPPVSYAYVRTFWFNSNDVSNPAVSGPLADPFGRGVPNVMAYALGSDPAHFDFSRMPRASTRSVAGTPYEVIEIRRAIPLRADLQYLVAESTDLATGFGTPFDVDAPANAARVFSRTDNTDGTETIVIRASAPLSASTHHFLRFSLNYTP